MILVSDDTAPVLVTVLSVDRPRKQKHVLAICTVAVEVDGVEIVIRGVTVRKERDTGTVELPHVRHPVTSEFMEAIGLPEEVRRPLGWAVLDAVGVVATAAEQIEGWFMIKLEIVKIDFAKAEVRFGDGATSITMTVTNVFQTPSVPEGVKLDDNLMARLTSEVNRAAKRMPRSDHPVTIVS